MKFYVKNVSFNPSGGKANAFYLIEDNWDDWYTYETMYDLFYLDYEKNQKYVGKVKIGGKNMSSNSKKPNIPDEFEYLDKNFFSLGQSDFYYANINQLKVSEEFNVFEKLNDIAYNLALFDEVINYHVTNMSLMRDISANMVRNQFHRIARGGARLTDYYFKYKTNLIIGTEKVTTELDFEVLPEIELPTNIHVIIGRNGVGKTRLIKNMIKSIINSKGDEEGKFEFLSKTNLIDSTGSSCQEENPFANVICVAFSAFDDFSTLKYNGIDEKPKVPFINIGLPSTSNNKTEDINNMVFDKNISKGTIEDNKKENGMTNKNRIDIITEDYVNSLKGCLRRDRIKLLNNILEYLETDPIFKEANIRELCNNTNQSNFEKIISNTFNRLSSGHKIILLTITKLIETVAEKSLVLLDEPEGHLHPPLLSAFIRGLSELLKNRNGVAIIATHSPVVLQEVPSRCAWKLRRIGKEAIYERLNIESFGENIGVLNREVFGYEVTNSGFHSLLKKAAEKYRDYDTVNQKFQNELGVEARAILRAILYDLEEREI